MKKITKLVSLLLVAMLLPLQSYASGNWENSFVKIMLDPGHGGSDPGAGAAGMPYEGVLVLRAGLAMQTWLKAHGNTPRMTRTTNATVSLSARRSASISYDPWVFCSIHLNAFNGTANGTETWYYWTTNNRHVNLANYVQKQLIAKLNRTNRGVKREAWTVITGAAYIPAILTEGLFVDNKTENALIAKESNAGFKAWVNAHLQGFYQFINSEKAGVTLTIAPDSDPYGGGGSTGGGTTTPTPTLTVPSGIYFEAYPNETPTVEVSVTAKDLTADITVESNIASRFKPSVTTLSKANGTKTFTVQMLIPYGTENKTGTYGPDGTGVPYDFKLTLTSGTGTSKITKTIPITATIKPYPLTDLAEKWNFSEKKNTKTKKGYDASNIRNFCYLNGKLYCVYNHSNILVLNAQTGEKLGYLKNGGVVSGGTLKLCDVKTVDGKIIACNLSGKDTDGPLRLYCWDSDNATPTVLHEVQRSEFGNNMTRLGDCLEINGSLSGKCRFAFGNGENSVTRVVEFVRENNAWSRVSYLLKAVSSAATTDISTQATVRVYPKSNGWWIDGKDSYPTWGKLNATTNNIERQTFLDTGESWGSTHHEFYWSKQKHSVNLIFNGKQYEADGTTVKKSGNYIGARMRFYQDPTGDFTRATTVADFPSDGLGDTSQNTNATGDCWVNTDGTSTVDGTYIEAWVLSTTHGMAYYAKGSVPAQSPAKLELQDPDSEVATPTISAASSMTFQADKGATQQQTLTVTGKNLTSGITVALSGANANQFSLAATSLAAAGGSLAVTYKPTAAGNHSATLTLTSGSTSTSVALTGTCTVPKGTLVLKSDKTTWFTCNADQSDFMSQGYREATFTVIGTGIDGNITMSFTGDSDNELTVTPATLPAEGGTVTVRYTPTVVRTTYFKPNLVASASNADSQQLTLNMKWDGTKPNTGATTDGTLKLDATQKYFTCNAAQSDFMSQGYREFTLKVTGTGISGNIKVATKDDTDNEVTVTPATLPAEGGSVVVRYTPTVVKDTYQYTYVVVSADNAAPVECKLFLKWDGTKPNTGTVTEGTITLDTSNLSYSTWTKMWNMYLKTNQGAPAVKTVKVEPKDVSGDITYVWGAEGDHSDLVVSPQSVSGKDGGVFTISYYGTKAPDSTKPTLWFKAANATSEKIIFQLTWDNIHCGVDNIAVDGNNDGVSYYTLQGVKVEAENLVPGLYIRREGNKATKVVIK